MNDTKVTCEQCGATWQPDHWFCPNDGELLLLGRAVGGDWILDKKLGGGAMGVVYRAHNPINAKLAAIKILGPRILEPTAPEVQRFVRESLARVRHPNCVEIQDIGALRDVDRKGRALWWIRMDYVEGASLEHEAAGAPLPAQRLLALADQMCAGLAACHAAGILHRDLKPANILVETATGTLKLTDFGIALLSGATKLTATGQNPGTPLYMGPELFEYEKASERSDLFALGVVLYELMTGRHPFLPPGATNLMQLIRRVAFEEPYTFASPPGLYPAGLEAVVLRLLRKKPEERFASAGELREALLGLTPIEVQVRNDDLGLDVTLVVARNLSLAEVRALAITAAAPLSPVTLRILRKTDTTFRWEVSSLPFADRNTVAEIASLAKGPGPVELLLRVQGGFLMN